MNKVNYNKVFFIVIVSILISIIFNHFSPTGIPLIKKKVVYVQTKHYDIQPITLETAFEMHGNEAVIFVDARETIEYENGHIEGAINIPYYDSLINSELINNLDTTKKYVVYCDDEKCGLSKMLAEKMFEKNIKSVFILTGGWQLWLSADLPISKEHSK